MLNEYDLAGHSEEELNERLDQLADVLLDLWLQEQKELQ